MKTLFTSLFTLMFVASSYAADCNQLTQDFNSKRGRFYFHAAWPKLVLVWKALETMPTAKETADIQVVVDQCQQERFVVSDYTHNR